MEISTYTGALPKRGAKESELTAALKAAIVESAAAGEWKAARLDAETSLSAVYVRIRQLAKVMGYKVSVSKVPETNTALFRAQYDTASPAPEPVAPTPAPTPKPPRSRAKK